MSGHYHNNLSKNKNGNFSLKITKWISLKIPEYEKNNFYWIIYQKWVLYKAGLNAIATCESFRGSISLESVEKHKNGHFRVKNVIKNPWKSLNRGKIPFIGFSILNRLCIKLEKCYSYMCKFLGVIITTICWKTFKTPNFSVEMMNKKSLKIPEREKITFIVFSTINRLCMKLEKMYCHMWKFWVVIITTICQKT